VQNLAHTSAAAPLLAMTGISKRFGATQALAEVSLAIRGGEVHALVGENGAGKSTLMKILSGAQRADTGQMSLLGASYRPAGPVDALQSGVAMIYQELNLAPHLSVEANIVLGQEPARWGWLSRSRQQKIAHSALARLGADDIPLDVEVGTLPIAAQQRVEIARALASEARVFVFDEPTSSLSEADARKLFVVIRDLKAAGYGVVYISHFLEEVAEISDVYTVLRDGRSVAHGAIAQVSLDELVRLMVGRELSDMFPRVPHAAGELALRIEGLSGERFPIESSLAIHRGEVLGIAGLIGSGRTELLRAVFGLDAVRSGQVRVATLGQVGSSPRDSIGKGLGFLSEDRKAEGLALELSIAENLTLSRLSDYRQWGLLRLKTRDRSTMDWMERINCRAAGPQQPIGQLSGGNQQKIAIARLLHQQADVLLLDEPTRGIDVATKAEIYRLLGELAAQDKAVVLVSSYLPELLGVADRIAVMCRGRLVDVRPRDEWTEESIMQSATRGAMEGAALR
jgi:ribose transport system ATP-binding protein